MVYSILDDIRIAAEKSILILPHAVRQMNRPDRMISPKEIRSVIEYGEVIKDYPKDPRGHSCLLLGRGDNKRTIHVVCSPKDDYLAIIPAYLPNPDEWDYEYRVRNE